MRRPYQIMGIAVILFGIFASYESYRLRFYTTFGPGPGFFPLLVSILLISLGAIILFQVAYGSSDPMPPDFFPPPHGYLRLTAIVLALVGVVLLMEPLGFRLTTLLFLVFMMITFGRRRLLVMALVALFGSFGTFYVFKYYLGVFLPTGMLGF